MEFDPHTLHQILQRIKQQMRCPQCGEKVPVDFASIRLTGDDFVLLQVKCDACEAYIVLHASLAGLKSVKAENDSPDAMLNASSALGLKEQEVETLRQSIEKSGGSFSSLFTSEKKPGAN
jgi:hypothetical protein